MRLGLAPESLQVVLSEGADFNATLTLTDASGTPTDWPVGAVVTLKLGATSYNATIATSDATWAIDKATTDPIADGTEAKLIYTNGTVDQVWAIGRVTRRD